MNGKLKNVKFYLTDTNITIDMIKATNENTYPNMRVITSVFSNLYKVLTIQIRLKTPERKIWKITYINGSPVRFVWCWFIFQVKTFIEIRFGPYCSRAIPITSLGYLI
jgi:hypothetical protein